MGNNGRYMYVYVIKRKMDVFIVMVKQLCISVRYMDKSEASKTEMTKSIFSWKFFNALHISDIFCPLNPKYLFSFVHHPLRYPLYKL